MTSPSPTSLSPQPDSLSENSAPPFLPVETKIAILRYCDQATLAKTSRVSLAFLQISSPLLYRDVEIHGIETLEKLFCVRDATHQPQLAPYLSLDNIQTLTFTEFREYVLPPSKLHLDRSKFAAVTLQRLSLALPAGCEVDDIAMGHEQITSFVSRELLPLFLLPELFIEGIFPPWSDLLGEELEDRDSYRPPGLALPPSALSNSYVHLKNASIHGYHVLHLRRLVVELSESIMEPNGRRMMGNFAFRLACTNFPLEHISGEAGLELWYESQERIGTLKENLKGRLERFNGVEVAKERLGRVQFVVRQS